MVIQRIQTLYLLLAVIVLTVFLFVPFGYTTFAEGGEAAIDAWRPLDLAGLLVPTCASAFLMLVAIFLYKSQSTQRLVVVFAMLLSIAAVGVVIYFMVAGLVDSNPAVSVVNTSWGWGIVLPICAVAFQIAATCGISRDMRLLSSYDRLR